MHLDMKNKINNLIDSKILIDESLKRHTTFGVGGIAAIFVYPENKKDLVKLLKYTSKNNNHINLNYFTASMNKDRFGML